MVDEIKGIVDLLTHTFRAYRFSTASDALGVGMKLAEFKPDLVVVNTRMPGLDGLDLCRRPKKEQVKVLAFEAPQDGDGSLQPRWA